MHDEITRYSREGEIDDNNLVESKSRLVHDLEIEMRDDGYVPALDLDPQFTLDYRPETGTFNYALTVYGISIGEQSWQVAGIMSGKTIMKYTAPHK